MPRPIRQGQHGVGGQRDSAHVAGELFKMMPASTWSMCLIADGARADRSPRRPGAGHFATWPHRSSTSGRQAARAGGDHRDASEALPDIPTVGDFVPGYEASTW